MEIGIRDFYQQMVDRKGVYPKSSMPSTQDYVEAFQTWAEKGIPVICICITTIWTRKIFLIDRIPPFHKNINT